MLPEVLSRFGWQTHCTGKTHFYPQRKHCGFDSLDSYEGTQNFDGLYVNDYHDWLEEKTNGQIKEVDHGLSFNSWDARPSHLPEHLHNNSWVATKSIEFLRRRDKTRPFFLNLSFHRPHSPIDPPQIYADMYKDSELPDIPHGDWAEKHAVPTYAIDAWHGKLETKRMDRMRRLYFAQISHIDNQIGRILRYLKTNKIGPNIIIFTSDHGEMLGDHNLFRKTYAYEGSAKIPLIISNAGSVKGRIVTDPVVIEDLYPTILDLAGIPETEEIDGLSLAPFCDSKNYSLKRNYVHGEHSKCYDEEEAMQFLTDGKEKYIWFTKTGKEQLFDLSADPQELHNLSSNPAYSQRLNYWRLNLIIQLKNRTGDGMSDGKRLIPGVLVPSVRKPLKEVRMQM